MQNARSTPDGMTPELMDMFQKVLSGYNPRQGKTSNLNDIMRHLATQDPSTVDALLNAVGNAESSRNVDLSTFDYASVPVKKEAFWVVQLLHMGYQDKNGRGSDDYFPGSEPVFQIMIYDDKNKYRAAEMNKVAGLPSSDFVLTAIKKAIASPVPPLRAALPSLLLVARKLGVHMPTLQPFLDSLPKPFSWRLETAEEEDEVASGIHDMNIAGVAKGLTAAESEKALGKKAVARKDRAQAVAHYTEAIESLHDARAQNPTDDEHKKIKTLLGVCLSNRAAAWLLPGDGQDASKALKDADDAIAHNPDYGKAYYRKAKAQQQLKEISNAIDTLCDALGKASLASEKGLVDTLVELYGGFPEEPVALQQCCKRMFRSPDGDKRARNISEFRRRAEEKLKSALGPDASLDGL